MLQPPSIDRTPLTITTGFLSILPLLRRRARNRLPKKELEVLLQHLESMLIDLRALVGEMLVQESDEEWLWYRCGIIDLGRGWM